MHWHTFIRSGFVIAISNLKTFCWVRIYLSPLIPPPPPYLFDASVKHHCFRSTNPLLSDFRVPADPSKGVLKLCDFGSAKKLIRGEPNVSYICSRYYRAPELIFGATDYTSAIDVWSGGCVMVELLCVTCPHSLILCNVIGTALNEILYPPMIFGFLFIGTPVSGMASLFFLETVGSINWLKS